MTSGFFTSLSLILAIGAQNAFVLRQGLKREYVTSIVLICSLSDAFLIAVGVSGFTTIGLTIPWLTEAMRWAGVAFLLVYGSQRFHAAWKGGEALLPSNSPVTSFASIMITCLVITWANPHVYLDTVMLLGSISAHYAPYAFEFGLGAALGSFVFFTTLGFGARILAPLFAKPKSWVILETMIGITMWSIAGTLALDRF